MISIRHEDEGPYTCIDCCGVEDVSMSNRDAMWKHLEDYHGWPSENKDTLHVKEKTPKSVSFS